MPNPRNDGAGITGVIRQARADFEQLTGRPVDRIVGVVAEDGGWRVTIEVVELERSPRTAWTSTTWHLCSRLTNGS
jgi:hypothetical protein